MQRYHFTPVILAAVASLAAFTPPVGAQSTRSTGIALIDLGDIAGAITGGFDVNNAGRVVRPGLDSVAGEHPRALLRVRGLDYDLGAVGGWTTRPAGMNNAGAVVGITGAGPFIWTSALGMHLLALGPHPAQPVDVNDRGQVASTLWTPEGPRASLYTPEHGIETITLPVGWSSEARGINNRGEVVGVMVAPDSGTRGFLWSQDGGVRDLGPLLPHDINNAGLIVGEWEDDLGGGVHAAMWHARDGLRLLAGATSVALGVNARGDAVGWSYQWLPDSGGWAVRAFLWPAAGGARELGTLDGGSSEAWAINNRGDIVGWSTGPAGTHGVLWTSGPAAR